MEKLDYLLGLSCLGLAGAIHFYARSLREQFSNGSNESDKARTRDILDTYCKVQTNAVDMSVDELLSFFREYPNLTRPITSMWESQIISMRRLVSFESERKLDSLELVAGELERKLHIIRDVMTHEH